MSMMNITRFIVGVLIITNIIKKIVLLLQVFHDFLMCGLQLKLQSAQHPIPNIFHSEFFQGGRGIGKNIANH